MHPVKWTGLALILVTAACGESQPSEPQRHIAVRSAEQDALIKLSPVNQKIAMRRALFDSGRTCQTVTEAGYVQEYGNLSMWTASCSSGKSYAVFVGPDGSAQVRDCRELEALKLPACKIKAPAKPAA